MTPCPWPDEPERISGARLAFACEHGGELTLRLLSEAGELGYLDPSPGLNLHIDVRCTWREAGETQHTRSEWHYDRADFGALWVDGPSPTEIRAGSILRAPIKAWTVYTGQEHRCPPQEVAGWRYFMRILHAPGPAPLPRVRPRAKLLV